MQVVQQGNCSLGFNFAWFNSFYGDQWDTSRAQLFASGNVGFAFEIPGGPHKLVVKFQPFGVSSLAIRKACARAASKFPLLRNVLTFFANEANVNQQQLSSENEFFKTVATVQQLATIGVSPGVVNFTVMPAGFVLNKKTYRTGCVVFHHGGQTIRSLSRVAMTAEQKEHIMQAIASLGQRLRQYNVARIGDLHTNNILYDSEQQRAWIIDPGELDSRSGIAAADQLTQMFADVAKKGSVATA